MDTEIKLSGWSPALMAGKTKLQEGGSLDLTFCDLSYCVGKGKFCHFIIINCPAINKKSILYFL
jgi:hypothetical protein